MNRLINLLKWPVALLMALLFVPALLTLARYVWQRLNDWPALWNQWHFAAGFLAAFLLWLTVLRGAKHTNWFYALEHELTHALFAALSWNRVVGVHAKRGGGEVSYFGEGNWLVTLAPYFFPLFCVPPLLAMQFATPGAMPYLQALLGFCFGLHLHSTWNETHWQQPDLQKYGRLASGLILPGAITLSLLAIFLCIPDQARAVTVAWRLSIDQVLSWPFVQQAIAFLPRW